MRTMSQSQQILEPLTNAIRTKLLPSLFDCDTPITDDEFELFSLPAREGGLGILNPTEEAPFSHEDSLQLTEQLRVAILKRDMAVVVDRKS